METKLYLAADNTIQGVEIITSVDRGLRRNDRCPCGSGKK
ncbi:MAG: hypothetical protein COW32_04390 [Candidatus Aquicultor secundus]|nr:MAG: hypothetical protein COW32_04390 [Candidatus Aquicultor secundus]